MEKMTQRMYFEEVIKIATELGREDLVEFSNGRIAQLDKKNANSTSKPKKVSEEQIALRKSITDYLATVEKASVSEICMALGITSSPKVTGNLMQLKKQGVVSEPIKVKQINYYSLAE